VKFDVFVLREKLKAKHIREHCYTPQKRIFGEWRDENPEAWRK
jgi:hypothetical protein